MDLSLSLFVEMFSESGKTRLLAEGKWGLEKEAQRVTSTGELALTPHPAVFGDKLENPGITVDFAESQVEMVTPPMDTIAGALGELEKLQDEVDAGIGGELLWPMSMPPRLPDEKMIPLARFADTEEGREKEIYRSGLALRYGRKMQMICGIHYNFSLGEGLIGLLYERFGNGRDRRSFTDDLYFTLMRNYLRYRWLLIYLFGASPSADASYHPVIRKEFGIVSKCCPECCSSMECHREHSTSLRVSRFGYSNSGKNKGEVYFDSLEEYTVKVRRLIKARSRRFAKLGVWKDGRRVQLNDRMLQKESEFYSSIRPKRIPEKGETMLEALEREGVEYLEVRILDLNPFEKAGISLEQLTFLHVFMLFCLFSGNSAISKRELADMNRNHHLAALSGRKPGLMLYGTGGVRVGITEWADEVFDGLEKLAALLESAGTGIAWLESVRNERRKLTDQALLPSSRIIREMAEKSESFLEFGLRMVKKNNKLIAEKEAV